MKKFTFLLLGIVLIFASLAFDCKKKNDGSNEPVLTVDCHTTQKSPAQATVCSRSGVSDSLLQAVDQEINQISADVDLRRYQNYRLPSNYVIFVLDNCVLSPESRTRSFLIRADAYDGTVFDQDPRTGIGRVYAAEYVVANNNGSLTNAYVVCNAPSADQDFRNAVRYGAEHIILYFNDRPEFERTAFHGNGINHPIIPSATSEESLRKEEKADVTDFGGRVEINN